MIQEEKSATLGVSQDQTLFQDVSVDLYNQDIYALQGGGATSQNSQGSTIKKNVGFTLNATDVHGVAVMAVDCRNGTEGCVNGTLQAKSNGGTSVNLQNIVRVGK